MYGYSTPASDIDIRGIVIPPREYIYGLRPSKFDSREFAIDANPLTGTPKTDIVIYSLARFLENCVKGSTENIELLFGTHCLDTKPLNVAPLRPLFRTRQTLAGAIGYAMAERRKVFAECETFTENHYAESFHKLCSVFNINSVERGFIIDYLERNRNYKIIERISNDKVGEKRAAVIAEHGYSGKNAAHCIRICEQAYEYLTTAHITFPRPNANFLAMIRNHALPAKQVRATIDESIARLSTIKDLPAAADMEAVNRYYLEKLDESFAKNHT